MTEAVTGVDIVQAQLRLAGGATLAELGLARDPPAPNGFAVQVRVNAETLRPDGSVLPSAGALAIFDPPTGPGVRVDTAAWTGGAVNPRFDSLLAKIVTCG